MPAQYLSTFQTGFTDLIKTILPKYLKDIRISLTLDGLIVYQSSATINQIRQLRFFNNSFLLLYHLNQPTANPLETILQAALTTNVTTAVHASLPHRPTTFRLMTYRDNQPTAAPKQLTTKLEQQLKHLPNFHLHKSHPKYEFWCFTRREGHAFYCLRFTRNPNDERALQPGELRPELANLLCQLSNPHPNDVFLDPFAGHGSIPFERARMYQANQIIAGDISPTLANHLKQTAKTLPRPITISQLDATNLPFPDQTFTAIVTDPPWALYDQQTDLTHLYPAMLTQFHRLLKPNCPLVILTAKPDLITNSLANTPLFTFEAQYHTLVSSQKATALKLRKL